MAVDGNTYEQGLVSPAMKPSNIPTQAPELLADFRRHLAVPCTIAGPAITVKAPWAGVLETVRSTQLLAGGGPAQNTVTLTVGGTNCYAAAGDGNTFPGNATAGDTQDNYPTDNLVTQDDGEDRVEFAKNDVIALGTTGANHGTVLYELSIARKMPQTV